eukprot:gene17870-24261_t
MEGRPGTHFGSASLMGPPWRVALAPARAVQASWDRHQGSPRDPLRQRKPHGTAMEGRPGTCFGSASLMGPPSRVAQGPTSATQASWDCNGGSFRHLLRQRKPHGTAIKGCPGTHFGNASLMGLQSRVAQAPASAAQASWDRHQGLPRDPLRQRKPHGTAMEDRPGPC